jgi:hypothetical protein
MEFLSIEFGLCRRNSINTPPEPGKMNIIEMRPLCNESIHPEGAQRASWEGLASPNQIML